MELKDYIANYQEYFIDITCLQGTQKRIISYPASSTWPSSNTLYMLIYLSLYIKYHTVCINCIK